MNQLMSAFDRMSLRRHARSPATWDAFSPPTTGTSYAAYHGWAGVYVNTPTGGIAISFRSQAEEVFAAARARSVAAWEALRADNIARARIVAEGLSPEQVSDLLAVDFPWQVSDLLDRAGHPAAPSLRNACGACHESCVSVLRGLRMLFPEAAKLADQPRWSGRRELRGEWSARCTLTAAQPSA